MTTSAFTAFLLEAQPRYEKMRRREIERFLAEIRPDDGWIGHWPDNHVQRGGIIQFWSPYDRYPVPYAQTCEGYLERFCAIWPATQWPKPKGDRSVLDYLPPCGVF